MNPAIIQDEQRKIKILPQVLSVMKSYVQKECFAPEAGGLLIGKENISNDNLIIDVTTEPMTKDRQTRFRYVRQDFGHKEMFDQIYKENGQIHRYVGEWHTHPEMMPNYSSIDNNNWVKIMKEDQYHSEHYHVIAGIESFRIWKIERDDLRPKLLCTIEWRSIYV